VGKNRHDEPDERNEDEGAEERPWRMRSPPDEDDEEAAVAGELRREDLRAIAGYQKGIIICILVYFGAVVAQFALPPDARIFLLIGVLAIGMMGTVFVFLLATKIYEPGRGVALGILTLIPIVGLIVLLIVNGKATTILKNHGIHVGLLGARSSDLPKGRDR